jgi:transcriptional regulator with XRE-family HTH domain
MNDRTAGGQKLRELRHARQWTQRDVERETKGLVPTQQVSRIESGAVADPSMKDLVALGEVYGLTPNDVAAMFGYWHSDSGSAREITLHLSAQVASRLPPLTPAIREMAARQVFLFLLGLQADEQTKAESERVTSEESGTSF